MVEVLSLSLNKSVLRRRRRLRGGGGGVSYEIVTTWLILPVVICLSQRLSHACLRTGPSNRRIREWLIKSVIIYWIANNPTRITVENPELIRATETSTRSSGLGRRAIIRIERCSFAEYSSVTPDNP